MPVKLRTPQIQALLREALEASQEDLSPLEAKMSEWLGRFDELLDDETPMTYLPVLVTALVGKAADASTDVFVIRGDGSYSAELIATNLTLFGKTNEVDVRSDSTQILNSQPFTRQQVITPDLTDNARYPVLIDALEGAQKLTQGEASEVLALAMAAGAEHWPKRKRRKSSGVAAADGPNVEPVDAVAVELPLLADAHLKLSDLRESCDDANLVIADDVLVALLAALNSGKHVILTGPPGTAKTTLAVLVADLAARAELSRGHVLTTATADWSTYDTIGGLTPTENGTLVFRPGRFLEALKSGRWLIVDELNRANFDRAFGQLFTVLAGADVDLPFNAEDGRPVAITHSAKSNPDRSEIHVPETWRLIATINNFDKTLLFELSFALMRRFAFIEVPAPSDDDYLYITENATAGYGEHPRQVAGQIVRALLPLRGVREAGPAIFVDAARMAAEMAAIDKDAPVELVVLKVFYAMLLPQFEGVDERQAKAVLKLLKPSLAGQSQEAVRVLREVLGVDLGAAAELASEESGE